MHPDLQSAIRTSEAHQLMILQDRIAAGLANVLDMRFDTPFSCPAEKYIQDTFRNANQALANGEIEAARCLNAVNGKLLQCLLTIQDYDDGLLDDFRQELHEVEIDRYFGTRREIETARSLIIKDKQFEHPDPPDFKLNYCGDQISIECTGCRVETSEKYRQKICDIIDEKNGGYSGCSTTLFLDVTDLIHNSVETEERFGRDQLKRWIEKDIEIFDWELGSILTWSYIYDRETSRYHHAYIRTDNSSIDPTLSEFLEDNYPIGNFEVDKWFLHSQN
jgi:hypothetical protein